MKAELMKQLQGKFWTKMEELIAELENKDLEVDDYNDEAIVVYAEEDEAEYTIYLIVAGNTIAVQDIQ